ncbi:MAG: hypothetical protein R3E62_01095 [Pseudomonadales bacterium]
MAPQRHRFSRRFLTILILATCIAILLLSRMDGAEQPATGNDETALEQ